MVRIKDPQNYILIGFEKSKYKNRMYNAIIINKITKREKKIPFGDKRMENYRDITGLNMYPKLIHNDKKRRKNFRRRTFKNAQYKFSSAWFSYNYLW